ncbi:S-adenosylmethionine mitochondrial carrier protein homolog [Phymastichus coffea]|uniref:S-adenosylmethionine mitochondrial carrier protein homolog n=1 Tax=Phymastichus coffea TaxID=108790 RepID=UPI00273C87EA|nr:S-adenosylmethionine mitochondrial carrier protein homolog [Phymastichus coffea]
MDFEEEKKFVIDTRNVFFSALISGGFAGTCVDVALFPIDTLKTRLQSENGFMRSGGFSKLYTGLAPVIMGSAPTAALFFVTYESIKMILHDSVRKEFLPFLHMGAASMAEIVSCLIRVPVEVVKQRRQALLPDQGRYNLKLLYRGYWSTVIRDMPFSLIQFSIWEYLKRIWAEQAQKDVYPFESAICGAMAGSIAAACTTPFDVVKTRIMLANRSVKKTTDLSVVNILLSVYKINGPSGLFAGIVPRVTWISIGGFIFFGVYEKSKAILDF